MTLWEQFTHRPTAEWEMKYEQWLEKRMAELENNEKKATRFVRHIQGHLDKGQYVICKICGKSIDEIWHGEEPKP